MSYVYLIEQDGTGYYKIGISRDPHKRLAALQTSNGHKLLLLLTVEVKDARRLEGMLHHRFAEFRCEGEWFDLPVVAVDEIKFWLSAVACHATTTAIYEHETETVTKIIRVPKESTLMAVRHVAKHIFKRRLFIGKTPIEPFGKEELVRQHLTEYIDDRKQSSRWLASNVRPNGIIISHVTWNKIKKEFD